MESFKKWIMQEDLGSSKTPPNLPRIIDGLVGNELSTDSGKTARERIGETGDLKFRNSVDRFKTKISEIPVPRRQNSKEGFGNLGSFVFQREVEKAGDNPTISQGIPVADLKGQFK